MTGQVDDSVSLEAVPSLDALFHLKEISDDELSQALKAGELSDLLIIRSGVDLNSSSLMDESVLEDTKRVLGARSGSDIVKNTMDPFYHLFGEFRTYCVTTDRPFIPPKELFVMKLTWFPKPSCALDDSYPY